VRKLAVFAVFALSFLAVLAAGGGASADSTGKGPVRTDGRGLWFLHACDRSLPGVAACHVDVVTNSAGVPLVTNPSPPAGALGPAQLRGAYGLTSAGSSSMTIGIVDAYNAPNIEADLAVYDQQYGLPACTTANGCFHKVNQTGGTAYPQTDPGWALEIALDVETAHAICPNCKILLVEASTNSLANLDAAENEAVTLGAKVISNSWGAAEYSTERNNDVFFNHPGVAITASTGDDGYGVQWPAASPYVTAVGGTTLAVNGTTWSSETAWSGAGSGCALYEPKPSWQKDTGCSRRSVADVSAVADPNTGAAIYDSTAYQGRSGWFQVGGTSLAAPLVASVYALTGASSFPNNASIPYAHAGSLHDVVSGSNGQCGGGYLCTAGPGFDGPTGLGTPNGLGGFTAGAAQPGFSVGVSPSSTTVAPGAPASFTVSVGSTGGYAGTVSLSVTGLPQGASASFSPSSVTGFGSSTLTIQTGAAAVGSYPLTITGSDGTTSHSASATLVVQSGPIGDFTIAVSPTVASIGSNSTSTYTVTIAPTGGFSSPVTFSASGFITGLSGSFAPNPATGTTTFTLKATNALRHSRPVITIRGSSGPLSHTTTLQVFVF
jgi:subtilase family serine protease